MQSSAVNAEVVQPYAQALMSVAFKQLDRTIGGCAFLTETTAKFRGAAQFSGKPIRQG